MVVIISISPTVGLVSTTTRCTQIARSRAQHGREEEEEEKRESKIYETLLCSTPQQQPNKSQLVSEWLTFCMAVKSVLSLGRIERTRPPLVILSKNQERKWNQFNNFSCDDDDDDGAHSSWDDDFSSSCISQQRFIVKLLKFHSGFHVAEARLDSQSLHHENYAWIGTFDRCTYRELCFFHRSPSNGHKMCLWSDIGLKFTSTCHPRAGPQSPKK